MKGPQLWRSLRQEKRAISRVLAPPGPRPTPPFLEFWSGFRCKKHALSLVLAPPGPRPTPPWGGGGGLKGPQPGDWGWGWGAGAGAGGPGFFNAWAGGVPRGGRAEAHGNPMGNPWHDHGVHGFHGFHCFTMPVPWFSHVVFPPTGGGEGRGPSEAHGEPMVQPWESNEKTMVLSLYYHGFIMVFARSILSIPRYTGRSSR